MKTHPLQATALLVALALLFPMAAIASGDRKGPPQGPPPEAITACEGKTAGDSVQFSGPRGETFTGTCREIDGQLAAAPDNMPEGGRPERR